MGRTGLHALAGGAITEITSGDFASGAAGAGMNQLLSGPLGGAANGLGGGDPGKTNAWRVAGSQLAGLAGAAAVDGNVNDGAWIAKQADAYNRQLHKDELKLIADNYKEYAEEQRALGRDITDGQALKELLYQAHAQVDAAYANDEDQKTWAFLSNVDEQAAGDFLGQISEGTAVTHDDGVTTTAFQATDDQKNNSFINYTHLLDTESGSYGELLFGYRRPILTNMSMDIGAGNYQKVLGFANEHAANQQFQQLAIIGGGGLAAPAFISAGVGAVGWTATQGQFLAGVGANAGVRGAQHFGASGYANLWQAESAAVYGAQRLGAWGVTQMGVMSDVVLSGGSRLSMAGTELIYGQQIRVVDGVVKAGAYWTGATFGLGVADGYFDFLGVDGPPGYVPSGLPYHAVAQGFFSGQMVGSGMNSFKDYLDLRDNDGTE